MKQISLVLCFLGALLSVVAYGQDRSLASPERSRTAAWQGVLHDSAGRGLKGVILELSDIASKRQFSAPTDKDGAFSFRSIAAGRYAVSAQWKGHRASLAKAVVLREGEQVSMWLELGPDGGTLILQEKPADGSSLKSGGEQLSSEEVSELPLNKRDFSQLLLLAAGTTSDTNGAANFTQQFAVNGQRGTASVFTMDSIYTSDPELGGSTFSNFNIDAIEEIQSSSGVMLPEVGRGAAGFTEIITKSGTNRVHGTFFEFFRNAALDARNFFDRRTVANPGRIPPFVRNEFGFTNGGPLVMPSVYDGRDKTFYFGQYQGFRQVLGTTQILPVPTPEERQGLNTTAFPGDTLWVPVSPMIAPVLARYPLPNDPQGPYGTRTYATSSKVTTVSDQFSIRIDHRLSNKARLFARFNLNNVTGPLTNPSQTAIDPSFGIHFLDHQRNFGLTYSRTISTKLTVETSFGFLRTTPLFSPLNSTQPALKFADGLYEAFNAPGGTVTGAYGNLFQGQQNFVYVHGSHTLKAGVETRFNRDTTIYGISPNGEYTFGGGTAYAPVEIRSASGLHDIHAGDPLPDALTGFLTATPFSYTISTAPSLFAQGQHIGNTGARRASYNFYFQDGWKILPRLTLNFGIRYEVNSRISEATRRTSGPVIVGPGGESVPSWTPGARQKLLINPKPPYNMDWGGWGPRVALEWGLSSKTLLRAGGGITTLLPNLWQTNFLTGGFPFVVNPFVSAAPGSPVQFQNQVIHMNLPDVYTPQGMPIYASGRSSDVLPNTEADLQRFQREMAALTHSRQINPLSIFGMEPGFRNGYFGSYSAGVEQELGDLRFSASYVATTGIKLPCLAFPNGYGGADPSFAPFTSFDADGRVQGGIGPELLMSSRSHSTFHSLQTSLAKTSSKGGLGFQASYTFSKSLDDTSAVMGGYLSGTSGAVQQTYPQDPRNPRAEKGPSGFDVTHVFASSLVQVLPLNRVAWLRPLGRRFTSGWQVLSITTLTSGAPFTVYSGIQQTGVGSNGTDRPDQVGQAVFSTSRNVREDYFGRGADNAEFFNIPTGIDDGTGPNHGRFGTLGRNTFRGPGFHNVDLALIKEIPLGRSDAVAGTNLQFKAEFFNVFNLVNFGLPANIVRGTGFGVISRTAGTSRQIQFSLKLNY